MKKRTRELYFYTALHPENLLILEMGKRYDQTIDVNIMFSTFEYEKDYIYIDSDFYKRMHRINRDDYVLIFNVLFNGKLKRRY